MANIIQDWDNSTQSLYQTFITIADGLGALSTRADCHELLRKARDLYGLKNIAYLTFNTPQLAAPGPYLAVTYSSDWVSHYREQRFETVDPVLRAGLDAILPVDWRTLGRSHSNVRRLFGDAADFRIGRHGLTFPIRGRYGEVALLSITSDDTDTAWDSTTRIFMRDFQVLAYHLHHAVLRIEGVRIDPVPLAPREQECLKWVARGKTVEEVAIILGLSRSTVRFYLDTARHKLDATNVTHAVVKAMQHSSLAV